MMFSELYTRGRRTISFEVFPPKTDAAMEALRQAMPQLTALRPDLITVTDGALGSTRERTLEIAGMIRGEYGMECACHLTCVGSSREELDLILERVRAAGIRNIVALRGDPPQGSAAFAAAKGGYRHAWELVSHIRRFEARTGHRFGVAVAGYPEKHLEAPDLATDLRHLRTKVDSGGDVVITQLFYDNRHYFEFVKLAREAGITVPIIPGLLPIISVKQILRITSLCGSTIPETLQKALDPAEGDDAMAQEIGVRHCIDQARALLERGAPGIHFYVLNRAAHMQQIMDGLR